MRNDTLLVMRNDTLILHAVASQSLDPFSLLNSVVMTIILL